MLSRRGQKRVSVRWRLAQAVVTAGLFALWFVPAPLAAQSVVLDEAIVEACYADAPLGAHAPDCAGAAAERCKEDNQGDPTAIAAACIRYEMGVWDWLYTAEYGGFLPALEAIDAQNPDQAVPRGQTLQASEQYWRLQRDADCRLLYALGQQDHPTALAASTRCELALTVARALRLRDLRGGLTP